MLSSLQSQQAASAFFFFNDTATTEIYTLSLHDALPISTVRHPRAALGLGPRHLAGLHGRRRRPVGRGRKSLPDPAGLSRPHPDRKSTRLNSSHSQISYAVFCLKKKKHNIYNYTTAQ